MKTSAQQIFKEFKEKVLANLYHPTEAIQTLKARLTASWLLQDNDPDIVRQAQVFIQKTSTFKEVDLVRLQQFVSQIKTWDEFQICSAYTNIAGNFLEYKLSFTTLDNHKKTVQFHAQFETKDHCCYFVSQTSPLIRLIGDPILHQPGLLFPQIPTTEQKQELERQIELAKSILIQTGGAGIAANQCAAIKHPYRFTIVGVFYDSPEHVKGVEQRYPTTKFPPARILVNPVINAISREKQCFNHGCLSIPGPNRSAILSPLEMSLTYQDPLEGLCMKQATFSGVAAIVLWHELTHILSGKTYMDVTYESLPLEDLNQFQQILKSELQNRQVQYHNYLPDLTVPPFYFSVKINGDGIPRLDQKVLLDVIPKISDETLAGLFYRAQCALKKNQKLSDKSVKGWLGSSIHSDENRQTQGNTEYTSELRMSKL